MPPATSATPPLPAHSKSTGAKARRIIREGRLRRAGDGTYRAEGSSGDIYEVGGTSCTCMGWRYSSPRMCCHSLAARMLEGQ